MGQKKEITLITGPKQTGKSWELAKLGAQQTYDLKNARTFMELSLRPSQIKEKLRSSPEVIAIDNIDVLPDLLKEVLPITGQIAGKLILTSELPKKIERLLGDLNFQAPERLLTSPLPYSDITYESLEDRLISGALPFLKKAKNANERAVLSENFLNQSFIFHLLSTFQIRKPESFLKTLKALAEFNGKVLNFDSTAEVFGMNARTLRSQVEELKDNLVINELPSLLMHARDRQSVKNSKYFYFDTSLIYGLKNENRISLQGQKSHEHLNTLIGAELFAYRSRRKPQQTINYWENYQGDNIDFILNENYAICISGDESIQENSLKPLKKFNSQKKIKRKMVVCFEPEFCKIKDIEIWPYQQFLAALWKDEIF